MKFPAALVLVLVVALSGAGCVSSARNQNNAVAGAAVGTALAKTPRDAHPSETAFDVTPPAATTGLSSPSVKRVELVRGPSDSSAVDRYMVAQPPPVPASTPRHMKPVRPAREAVWIDGYWAYTGNPAAPYEWMAGHWEIPPPGARSWVPSGWQPAGSSYIFVRGRWR